MRIRSHLLLLTIVVLVPGFLAAVLVLTKLRASERDATLRALHETVRATSLLVDGQVQRSLGALTILAQSYHLQTGNFAALYDEASAADQKPDVWTVVFDADGNEKLNTSVPLGTPLAPPYARGPVAQVLKTRKAWVSDVVVAAGTGQLMTKIYLPANALPSGSFVVAQALSVDYWNKTSIRPKGREQWIVAVIDRHGKFIWRSHRAGEYVGRDARPELVAAAAATDLGMIRHSTLEGIDVYDAFAHSELTGWTIAVAAPVPTIEASATQAVVWLAAGVAVALGLAILAASLLSRMLLNAIQTASEAARALGRGELQSTPPTAVHEVNVLHQSLNHAARVLGQERKAREHSDRQREQLLVNERTAREVAQEEVLAKDRFLALLGHELRNPLAAIAGATDVLARSAPDAATHQRFVALIQRQNRHLRRIVDDLLEVSRMMSGKIVLDAHALELSDCVRSCIEAFRASERARGFRWSLRTQPVWVNGDPVRLEQIINNLLLNAVQYSPPGAEVAVSVMAEGDVAVVEVSDSGPGIPTDLWARIFEPFVQGPAAPGRPSSGLGIGLSLVKQLVQLHGGSVSVRSAPAGVGSTFAVTLPRIAPLVVRPPSAPVLASLPGRVLLVDDNADAREATAALMRSMGHEVIEADDGVSAVRAALAHRPDVIVMDLGLPQRSGYLVAADMKALPELHLVPLLALSGYGRESDREAALAAGFAEHLIKPVAFDALAMALQTQLERRPR